MPLQLISPPDRFMLKRSVDARPVILGHLHSVLKSFAMKPEYSKFYIGITRDLDARLADHQGKKPDFKLMVPIYEEPANIVDSAFDVLEHEAIKTFRDGIIHPDTRKTLLRCTNGPGGARPKTLLYILVG
jgi:hypothetical protein